MIWQNHRRIKQSRLRKVELEKLISGSGDSCEVHNLDLKDLTTSGMFVFIHASFNVLKSETLNDALHDLVPNRAKHHNLKSEDKGVIPAITIMVLWQLVYLRYTKYYSKLPEICHG